MASAVDYMRERSTSNCVPNFPKCFKLCCLLQILKVVLKTVECSNTCITGYNVLSYFRGKTGWAIHDAASNLLNRSASALKSYSGYIICLNWSCGIGTSKVVNWVAIVMSYFVQVAANISLKNRHHNIPAKSTRYSKFKFHGLLII